MPAPRRILQHALFIAAIAGVTASVVHLPLLRRFARGEFRTAFLDADRSAAIRTITLAEAEDLFTGGGALFIDARAADLFAAGHVPSARNLPYERRRRSLRREAVGVPPERTIVLYCEGGDCRSSLGLARLLAGLDYRDVRVFPGGWAEWLRAGLPVEGGT